MKGYGHDLGREKTNLDVLYTILNLFFAQNTSFPKSPSKTAYAQVWPPLFLFGSFIPFPEVVSETVGLAINGIISSICVGYQYQRFGMSFGVKPTYFQYQIDLPTPSAEKIDFRKIGFLAHFGSHRKPYIEPLKYLVRNYAHK